MSDPAPPKLVAAHSFSGTDSLSINIPPRRIPSTSTLEFFAPAAKSFQPLPYSPHALFSASDKNAKPFTTRHPQRSQEPMANPGMDPLASDPDVVFIHPPFLTFPNSHLHKEGLSYQLLANNPEWFLDANDFIRKNSNTPGAIPYPPILEPPRGWCPARKKDLKDRGSEGWPEGEEPRLRCTFCRRTYAGVNAKSMWRRHVFEKHKIAMANRRDGNDRPRGRGTGKENKQSSSSKPREEPHDKLLNLEIAPQTNSDIEAHKSKFRSGLPPDETKQLRSREKREDIVFAPTTPDLAQPEASSSKISIGNADGVDLEAVYFGSSAMSPLLRPTEHTLPDDLLHELVEGAGPVLAEESTSHIPILSSDSSPTPSFRHSPPHLPSEQPWRYPSPSHPHHSQRDVTLVMLAPSPLVKSVRSSGRSPQSSPFSTPNVGRSSDLKTPSTLGFSLKSASRPWLFRHPFDSPLDKHSKGKGRLMSSPFSSSLRGTPAKRGLSAFSDDWLGDSMLHPDFFGACSPWNRMTSDSSPRKVVRSMGDVSPVLRTGPLPSDVGLGTGLLAPFCLPKETPTLEEIDAELEEMDRSEIGKPPGLRISLEPPLSDSPSQGSPPPKKRRRMSNT